MLTCSEACVDRKGTRMEACRGIEYSGLPGDTPEGIELQEIVLLTEGASIQRKVSDVTQQAATDMRRFATRRSTTKWKIVLCLGGLSLAGIAAGVLLSSRHYRSNASVAQGAYGGNGLTSSAERAQKIKSTTMPRDPGEQSSPAPLLSTPVASSVPTLTRRSPEHTVPYVSRLEVLCGESATVSDAHALLFTQDVLHQAVLAVLSGWNGEYYQRRTLMHFSGHALRDGLAGDAEAEGAIAALQQELKRGGGKAIWARGSDHADGGELGRLIGQFNTEGKQPILDLMKTPDLSLVIASATGITLYPNGEFELQGSTASARACPDWEHCVYIFND